MRQNKAEKLVDKRIDKAFLATCKNIPISVLDISKVFCLGRTAVAQGADDAKLESTIRDFVETIRK